MLAFQFSLSRFFNLSFNLPGRIEQLSILFIEIQRRIEKRRWERPPNFQFSLSRFEEKAIRDREMEEILSILFIEIQGGIRHGLK